MDNFNHLSSENKPITFVREGYILSTDYLKLALDAYVAYSMHMEKSEKSFDTEDNIDGVRFETIKVIIFICCFLESYFFDYSAIVLGDSYTEKYIDINIESKIILTVRLITGKDIKLDSHYLGDIKAIITCRNKLIHNKTKDCLDKDIFNTNNVNPLHISANPLHKNFDLHRYFKSLYELFKELQTLDPNFLMHQHICKKIKEKVNFN